MCCCCCILSSSSSRTPTAALSASIVSWASIASSALIVAAAPAVIVPYVPQYRFDSFSIHVSVAAAVKKEEGAEKRNKKEEESEIDAVLFNHNYCYYSSYYPIYSDGMYCLSYGLPIRFRASYHCYYCALSCYMV